MQKIVNELISSSIKGVDVYRWRGATWLIFTDETRWVVELTDEGTLWYNYRFFNDIFRYVSMEVGQQTEKYIIEWANDFFYKDCAHRTILYPCDKARNETPKVLENGIKNVNRTRDTGEDYIKKVVDGGINETQQRGKNHGDEFEWHTLAVIDNGVKEISSSDRGEPKPEFIEEVVNQGIKEVNQSESIHRQMRAENVMNQIIKKVKPNRVTVHDEKMDRFYYDPNCTANFTMLTDIVEEGVKQVKPNVVFHGIDKKSMSFAPCNGNTTDINIIVENGVKNIYPDKSPDDYDWSDEFKADNVIQGGIKVIPLPDPSGELRGYSDYYNTKEDRTKPHTDYVNDVIEGGTKL
jgi:hypothetical protein